MKSILRSTGIAVLLLGSASAAHAETTNCTVVIPPATINLPGIYCLNSSHTVSGNALWIAADHVVFDLNGHTLQGSGGGVGIQSTSENHITVRNGTVRDFAHGISLGAGGTGDGNVVEDMRLVSNSEIALSVSGRGAVVRNNQLIGNGSSTGPGARYGIAVTGPGSVVKNNKVIDTGLGAPGEVVGIRVFIASGSVVQDNVITNSGQAGVPTAIKSLKSVGTSVVGNRISGYAAGIQFSGSGIYMDNTVGGATTPFFGGTAAGATNFTF